MAAARAHGPAASNGKKKGPIRFGEIPERAQVGKRPCGVPYSPVSYSSTPRRGQVKKTRDGVRRKPGRNRT